MATRLHMSSWTQWCTIVAFTSPSVVGGSIGSYEIHHVGLRWLNGQGRNLTVHGGCLQELQGWIEWSQGETESSPLTVALCICSRFIDSVVHQMLHLQPLQKPTSVGTRHYLLAILHCVQPLVVFVRVLVSRLLKQITPTIFTL